MCEGSGYVSERVLFFRHVLVFLVGLICVCSGADGGELAISFFANDLYPACVAIDEPAAPWVIEQALIEQSVVSGTAMIDDEMRYDGKPTLLLRPTEKAGQVSVARMIEAEQGAFYSFTCVARGADRKADDPPAFLPCSRRFILVEWLDVNGARIPTRDKLMSRVSGEDAWHIKHVNALAPKGAVKARLTLKAGSHSPRDDSGMWFAEIKCFKAIPAPVKLAIIPRVIRSDDEEFTVRIERRAQYSLDTDCEIHIELVNGSGDVLREWMTPNAITLPWEIRTKLPRGEERCYIKVSNKRLSDSMSVLRIGSYRRADFDLQ